MIFTPLVVNFLRIVIKEQGGSGEILIFRDSELIITHNNPQIFGFSTKF